MCVHALTVYGYLDDALFWSSSGDQPSFLWLFFMAVMTANYSFSYFNGKLLLWTPFFNFEQQIYLENILYTFENIIFPVEKFVEPA